MFFLLSRSSATHRISRFYCRPLFQVGKLPEFLCKKPTPCIGACHEVPWFRNAHFGTKNVLLLPDAGSIIEKTTAAHENISLLCMQQHSQWRKLVTGNHYEPLITLAKLISTLMMVDRSSSSNQTFLALPNSFSRVFWLIEVCLTVFSILCRPSRSLIKSTSSVLRVISLFDEAKEAALAKHFIS